MRTQTGPFVHVLAALLAVSAELRSQLAANFGLTGNYQSMTGEPLSAAGDADGDGHSNGEEYESVRRAGGDAQDYVTAALSPRITGDGVLPVAGIPAIALLAGALLLAGRRKRTTDGHR